MMSRAELAVKRAKMAATELPRKTGWHDTLKRACRADASLLAIARDQDERMANLIHKAQQDFGKAAVASALRIK